MELRQALIMDLMVDAAVVAVEMLLLQEAQAYQDKVLLEDQQTVVVVVAAEAQVQLVIIQQEMANLHLQDMAEMEQQIQFQELLLHTVAVVVVQHIHHLVKMQHY